MILNNFEAMRRVSELRLETLTPELVQELHRIVSRDTLSSKDAEGRLQTPDEERVSIWTPGVDPRILHTPPNAGELPARLKTMCDFANGLNERGFMHPVIRAIVLHFWLAYDHPFEDGNGRTARTLFYWSMLHDNYWLAEYVPISRVLRRRPAQYARAFLYTETDENDLTYFLLFNLSVIEKAVKELHSYLRAKIAEVREAEQYLKATAHLNRRQMTLLSHAMRHPDHIYTIESHRRSNDVVYQTARSDLLGLVSDGYLTQFRFGRALGFVAHPDLPRQAQASQRRPQLQVVAS
jgi:Fic family protein